MLRRAEFDRDALDGLAFCVAVLQREERLLPDVARLLQGALGKPAGTPLRVPERGGEGETACSATCEGALQLGRQAIDGGDDLVRLAHRFVK